MYDFETTLYAIPVLEILKFTSNYLFNFLHTLLLRQ